MKHQILTNPEYNDWWPIRRDNQEPKRRKLIRKYAKAFYNICYNAAPGKKLRRHVYWINVAARLDKRLAKFCKQ